MSEDNSRAASLERRLDVAEEVLRILAAEAVYLPSLSEETRRVLRKYTVESKAE